MVQDKKGGVMDKICEAKVLWNTEDNLKSSDDILELLRKTFNFQPSADSSYGVPERSPNILDDVLDNQGKLRFRLIAIHELIQNNIINKIL